MSDYENPYASPATITAPENKLIENPVLTETMLTYLKQASPWLRFMGIMGYISCGSIALFGISFIFFAGSLSSLFDGIPGMGSFTGAISVSTAFMFIGIAALVFFPSHFTYNFGAKLRTYFENGKEQELELAFKNNKSYWKFYGILMIINLATIPVSIVLGVIIAIVAIAVK